MSERIPVLNDLTDYGLWKKEVNIWVLGTQAKAEQQAARLIGFMSGKAHEAAIQIPPAELGTVAKLTTELDKLFLKDDTQSLFQAIEEFEQYNRSKEDSIDDYIRGFEQRYKRLKTYVVNSKIPLLLSRQMMNDFSFVIDMRQKKVYAMGGEEPILDTTSGHLVVSINGGAFIRVNPCRIVQNEQSSQTDDVPEKEQRPHPKAKTHDSHESEGEKRFPTKTATWFYETVYYSDSEEEEDSTSTSATNEEVDISSTAVRQETIPLLQEATASVEEEETTPLPQEATPSVEEEETTPLPQEVTPPVEIKEEETQPKWTSEEQPKGKKNAVILKKGDTIRFKDGDNEEWKCGLIDSRAGKATGTHKNSYNVHVDGEDEAQVIDLTDKRVERLLCKEENKLTVTKEVPKQVPKKVPTQKIVREK